MASVGDKYILSPKGFVYGPESTKKAPMNPPSWVPDPNKPLNEQTPPSPPRTRGKTTQSGKSRRRNRTRRSRRTTRRRV